jgi:hypothetical protein
MPETNDEIRLEPGARVQIVLIPGFAGFDALGQLEYYAGVTPLFSVWQRRRPERAAVALHYFDNFPTASVAVRAGRLASFLAKRVARGEISSNDSIALVGHSTGGLDIRHLIRDLAHIRQPILVDGGADNALPVNPKEILRRVKRIVFLSVPQWGTNIADWVTARTWERQLVVGKLRATVAASQVPLLDTLERLLAGSAANLLKAGLVYALQDALREAEADTPRNEMGTAMAQEAASVLQLWLRHITSDFRAIDDLTSWSPHGDDRSPAHYTAQGRREEEAVWKQHRIGVRSYATRGPNPFRFTHTPVPVWELLKPWTGPECDLERKTSAATDIVYRACYRACAAGPFDFPPCPDPPTATHLLKGLSEPVALWDNDGIVNTASMLWPNGEETLLLDADHMDIVGHYHDVEARPGSDRKFQAYNLLKSGSDVERRNSPAFEKVWEGVFDFCCP